MNTKEKVCISILMVCMLIKTSKYLEVLKNNLFTAKYFK